MTYPVNTFHPEITAKYQNNVTKSNELRYNQCFKDIESCICVSDKQSGKNIQAIINGN